MKVLVVGSGGREHALAWKISKSPMCKKIYCAPGNAGISSVAECVEMDPRDVSSVAEFARSHSVDLTVIGPEQPLAEGISDHLAANGLKVFGPSKRAARIETSKVFSKELMATYGIPTARFGAFTNMEKAQRYAENMNLPVVVKADGLAAGKGVTVCKDYDEVSKALDAMMVQRTFGQAGDVVIVEEYLEGFEVSVMAVVSGTDLLFLPSAQDHKQAYDGDQGPNTGGMGAYSPMPSLSSKQLDEITRNIFVQTVHALQKEGSVFSGLLYAGLMITSRGPYVLEFNCRFGDPETQAILPRLKFDLLPVLKAASDMKLADLKLDLEWDPRYSVCVVMASGGYPGAFKTGHPVIGLESDFGPDVQVFHSGTRKRMGEVVTSGGRVLGVTGLGSTLAEARAKAYSAVNRISFKDAHYRTDIGRRERR